MVNINKELIDNDITLYQIEQNFDDKVELNSNIKINNIRVPYSTVTIILANNDKVIGHISANLYKDNTASLCMSGIRNVELPDNLEEYHDQINSHDVALYVIEEYRQQGYAKRLLKMMLELLNKKGITTLKVDSISDQKASNLYVGTGATLLDEKNAVYENIDEILKL